MFTTRSCGYGPGPQPRAIDQVFADDAELLRCVLAHLCFRFESLCRPECRDGRKEKGERKGKKGQSQGAKGTGATVKASRNLMRVLRSKRSGGE